MISLHCLLLNLIAAASSTMLINQPLKEMPLDWEPVAPTAAFAFTFDCKAIPKAQCKQAR